MRSNGSGEDVPSEDDDPSGLTGMNRPSIMKYSKVYIESIGYEIAPVVVSSLELERRLRDVYAALHLSEGQLEALTGIAERRWWEEGHRLSDGAIAAARRALAASDVRPDQLDAVIYGAVCREYFEPATACRVASALGVGPEAAVYDVSNACLGVLNGIVEVANRIEAGPGPRRAGRGVRGVARDQRDRDRAIAREADDGLLQAVAGDPDRRFGRRGRAPDRRLVRDAPRAEARRRRLADGPAVSTTSADGGSSRPARTDRGPTISSPRPTRRPS